MAHSRVKRVATQTTQKRKPERIVNLQSAVRARRQNVQGKAVSPIAVEGEDYYDTSDTLMLVEPTESIAAGRDPDGASSFYFKVNSEAANYSYFNDSSQHPVRFSLHYLDVGTQTITLEYSSNGTTANATKTIVTKTNTGEWKWKAITVSNMRFVHSVYSSNENADFRVYSSAAFHADAARLRETTVKKKVNWKANDFDENTESGDADSGESSNEGAYFGNSLDTIGAWAIEDEYLIYDTGTDATSAGLAPLDYPFYAGATYDNRATAPFRVTPAGAMYSTSGQIANWDIGVVDAYTISADNGKIRLNSQTPYISLGNSVSGVLTGKGIWMGKDGGDWDLRVGDPSDAYMHYDGSAGKLKVIKGKHKGASQLGDSDDGATDTDVLTVYGHMQSDDWVSGVTGTGWRISNAGRAVFRNIVARGSIRSSVFEADVVSAVAGTMVIAKSAGKLDVTMSVPSSGTWTMSIEDPPSTGWLFANGDIIRVKETQGSVSETWFTVTRSTQSGGHQTYTCTFASGTRPASYEKGLGVLDYGQSGHGFLELSADGTGAPYYSVRTHAGAPWSTVTERGRFGNMNGAFGIASDYYGFAVGDYSGGNYLRYETNGGFILKAGNSGTTIDSNGLSFNADGTDFVRWMSGATRVAYISSNVSGGQSSLLNYVRGVSGNVEGYLSLFSQDYAGTGFVNLILETASDRMRVIVNGASNNLEYSSTNFLVTYTSGNGFSFVDSGSTLQITGTSPALKLYDFSAGAKSLLLTVDANVASFGEVTGGNFVYFDLANARVGIGIAAPTVNLHVSYATAGTASHSLIEHTDNTDGASHATHQLKVGGASGGDARLAFTVTGVTDWMIGVDNSDSDKFKISKNFGLGTNDYLTIDTSGTVGVGTALTVTGAFTSIGIDDNSNAVAMTIDSTERIIVGHTSSINHGGSNFMLQINSATTSAAAVAGLSTAQWSADTRSSQIVQSKSRNASIGSFTIVQSGDVLGNLIFAGDDGAAFIQAANIRALVDGTPGTNDMPGRLEFLVTADGAVSPSLAMTINNDKSATFKHFIKSDNATAGIGYATGAGGTVTQLTSKSTGVTLNKVCGQITMHNAALAANTTVSFTLTNSAIAAGDVLVLNHISGGTAGSYLINAQSAAGSASINVRNITTGSLSEAIVIAFAVIKGVTS